MPRPRVLITSTLLCALLLLAHARYYSGILYDDPFISYRYARNLAAGEGFVFSRGEYVEGYSNFLHVVALAAFSKAGVEPPIAGPVMTFAAAVAVLALLAWGAARGAIDVRAAMVAQWLLVMSPSFAFWPPRGLETSSHAALVFGGMWLAGRALAAGCSGSDSSRPAFAAARPARAWIGAWVCFTAAGMMRIEGPMFGLIAGAFGVMAMLAARLRPTWRVNLAGAAGFWAGAALFVVGLATYHAWRLWYFGDPLPNTYHAKATGPLLERWRAGIVYLHDTALHVLAPMLATLLLGWLVVFAHAATQPKDAPSAAVPRGERLLPPVVLLFFVAGLGAQVFFAFWVGGDWMGYARFLMPMVPVLALLAGDAFARVFAIETDAALPGRARAIAPAFVVVAAVAGLAWGIARAEPVMRAARGGYLAQRISALGEWIDSDARRRDLPDAVVALEEMGLIPWHAPHLRFIDLYGLVTREVAHLDGGLHQKRAAATWALDQRPEYIVILAVPQPEPDVATMQGIFPASQDILADPRFADGYVAMRREPRGTPLFGRLDMIAFVRRDLLDR